MFDAYRTVFVPVQLEVRRFDVLVVVGFVADPEVPVVDAAVAVVAVGLVVRAGVVVRAALVVSAAVHFAGRLLAVVDSCWD